MRGYLFRGKRIDNGEWVYGDLVQGQLMYIVVSEFYEVDPTTIGQYTGLIDKNGTKIFEGDIVTWDDGNFYIWKDGKQPQVVVPSIDEIIKDTCDWNFDTFILRSDDVEVIGNIHEREVTK